ncbi:hypothetical protein NDR87_02985 [Nocardia sp. CDC159]|uniref:1-deoxy-D-xylulose-5-phosphate synthase n=1 Tax=Nocardia pulmonis TaxID=2951408 RepID=A0A9X2E0Z7_9NOCA|nr:MULTISPECIES: transketolase C-terminal domain-containing protein [Nocardia]MCM6772022.1 hypothetical protein [Nocardia pulmonis]MCM6785320.1 hypothetical protein [Nocardia sp. CDC159]
MDTNPGTPIPRSEIDAAGLRSMAHAALHRVFDARRDPIIVDTRGGAASVLSSADGLAKAFELTGQDDRHVAVVVESESLDVGLCWEAWNNLVLGRQRSVVMVVIGEFRHRPFADLRITYFGPVDDPAVLESALRHAKSHGGPVVVHLVGGSPAAPRPLTGRDAVASEWADVLGGELVAHAERRIDIVAVTAATAGPTGLGPFAERFPERMFDVGAGEQHAVTSAAGLALGGTHPVVGLGSTGLSRALDQILMDVALLALPVTFVLARSEAAPPQRANHHGSRELALLGMVPGLRVGAPRDGASLRRLVAQALTHDVGPTALRLPEGAVPEEIPVIERIDGVDVVHQPPGECAALLVAVGPCVAAAVAAARLLAARGVVARVVDPRWVLPVPEALLKLADGHRLVVTIEDGLAHAGFGAALSAALRASGIDVPVRGLGVPHRLVTDSAIARSVLRHLEAGRSAG